MTWLQKITLISCFLMFSQPSWARGVDDETLQRSLAYGKVIELNQYSKGVEKNLMLRLFSTTALGEECGLENDGICRNQYLLTSATFDELPEVQVHLLNVKGEFIKAAWMKPGSGNMAPDDAELIMTFREYHQVAMAANSDLKRRVVKVKVKITPNGIEETIQIK